MISLVRGHVVHTSSLPRDPFGFEKGEATVIPKLITVKILLDEEFSNGLVTTPTLLWPESLCRSWRTASRVLRMQAFKESDYLRSARGRRSLRRQ